MVALDVISKNGMLHSTLLDHSEYFKSLSNEQIPLKKGYHEKMMVEFIHIKVVGY